MFCKLSDFKNAPLSAPICKQRILSELKFSDSFVLCVLITFVCMFFRQILCFGLLGFSLHVLVSPYPIDEMLLTKYLKRSPQQLLAFNHSYIYIYLLYLPFYFLPAWGFCFVCCKHLSLKSKWCILTNPRLAVSIQALCVVTVA